MYDLKSQVENAIAKIGEVRGQINPLFNEVAKKLEPFNGVFHKITEIV